MDKRLTTLTENPALTIALFFSNTRVSRASFFWLPRDSASNL
jgi:hypothetical protein